MTIPQLDFDGVFQELYRAKLSPKVLRLDTRQMPASEICVDSRKISSNSIFCPIKGANIDGHQLISKLTHAPALILVDVGSSFAPDELEADLEAINHCGIIEVSSTRAAWAQMASFFSGHPSNSLNMIAITGTNGKTSTVAMIRSLFDGLGCQAATIGTLGFILGKDRQESSHTTPDPDVLYPKLQEWLSKGVKHVIMEVSSHSLIQGKVQPIIYSAAAFTSFSQDHLDFHASMEEYLLAKLLLFKRHLKAGGLALFNENVYQLPLVREVCQQIAKTTKVYSRAKTTSSTNSLNCDIRVVAKSFYNLGLAKIEITDTRSNDTGKFAIPIVGDVFSENFAAALVLVSNASGNSFSQLSSTLHSWRVSPVSGRLELVDSHLLPWRPLVYVDYAHTPDALQKAIENLSSTPNSVTTVFGCGGDRDKTKRPVMGKLAGLLSKRVFVTSDNPRTEDPETICEEILKGAPKGSKNIFKIIDRQTAIAKAIKISHGEEVVLVAGKGHEDYQIIGTQKREFRDQDVAEQELSKPITWLVFGAGVSGFAAANHLQHFRDVVSISDDKTISNHEDLDPRVSVIDRSQIKWDTVDKVLISPGIPLNHDVVVVAKSLGLEVITEIDLGFNNYQGTIIAITGTNGKSTTVAMTEFLLKNLNLNAIACGNIGLPPSGLNLREASADHISVVELSSYQLEGCLRKPARAAAITSFSFDHIARHKTLEAYFDAKWAVSTWLDSDGIFIVSHDVATFAHKSKCQWPPCEVIILGNGLNEIPLLENMSYLDVSAIHDYHAKRPLFNDLNKVDFNGLNIRGIHNQMNALSAAIFASMFSNRSPIHLLTILKDYQALPYRCEVVFDDKQRCIINDSKSTNLESTIAALTMAKRPAVLMMGGQGKGESYQSLSLFEKNISHLICFGASRNEIAKDAHSLKHVEVFSKMHDAVLRALAIARENNCDVIFSPGCASFDEFKNFEHRGKIFNEIVSANLAISSP